MKLSKRGTISVLGLKPFQLSSGYALLSVIKVNGDLLGCCIVTTEDQIDPKELSNQGQLHSLVALTNIEIEFLETVDLESRYTFNQKLLTYATLRETSSDVSQRILAVLETLGKELPVDSEGFLPFDFSHQLLGQLVNATRSSATLVLGKLNKASGVERYYRRMRVNLPEICKLSLQQFRD